VLFVLVIRLTPPGSPLDYDRAGPLWAGLALGLADGLGATLALGSRTIIGRETARPYAQAQDLAGASGLDAARDVAAPERASLLRGAVLALLGGLPVVESIFDVQGLGETVRDLVVDRRGLDPLLLSSTLLLYALLITVVLHLPWEWLARRLP
jgi:ABC-type dipeptide/oligopeptide/nickel transport system permease component